MQPRVGDTVILELEVVSINEETFKYKTVSGYASATAVSKCWIKEVIPKPIEVGQVVRAVGDILPNFYYTVLAVHGSDTPLVMPMGPTRRWAVCAHMDDIPRVFNVGELQCVA